MTCEKSELKVREYELYTGYYCGVCKSTGSRFGQLPRIILSYDAAFLAMLMALEYGEDPVISRERCLPHPAKERFVVRCGAVDYAADVMLILAWFNADDDVRDEGGAKARAARGMLKSAYSRLRKRYPSLCAGISAALGVLSALEAEKCPGLDMAAETFAKIMKLIFTSYEPGPDPEREPVSESGSDSDRNSDPESEDEEGSECGPESEREPGTESGSDSGRDSDSESEDETES